MQIICTKKRDRKRKVIEAYVEHPSFAVPWGVNIRDLMIWGGVKFRVINPKVLVEKCDGNIKCWTQEQNGVSYFADFFVEAGEVNGVSIVFRDLILEYIKDVIENYINKNGDKEITDSDLCTYIKESEGYKDMCKYFQSSQCATEVQGITVVQVKKKQENN